LNEMEGRLTVYYICFKGLRDAALLLSALSSAMLATIKWKQRASCAKSERAWRLAQGSLISEWAWSASTSINTFFSIWFCPTEATNKLQKCLFSRAPTTAIRQFQSHSQHRRLIIAGTAFLRACRQRGGGGRGAAGGFAAAVCVAPLVEF
jgi:hypothetical protein